MLWLGEQISEKGIGNGVSLMIFAGIVLSSPSDGAADLAGVQNGAVGWWSIPILLVIFLGATWFIVYSPPHSGGYRSNT